MNVVIFYENIEREMQNAILLKCELIRRGHNVYIINPFYVDTIINGTINEISFCPDVVLTPYLYTDNQLIAFRDMFKEKIPRIINLQYEQIFSEFELENNFQIPNGIKKNAVHLCWNNKWKDKLMENGIEDKNSVLVGSLNIDLCRERFSSIYLNRYDLSLKYDLDISKNWILFISSMAFADSNDFKKQFHYSSENWGKNRTDERVEIDTNSRDIIISWIEKYIKENDCEFIYRPHPGEFINDKLKKIATKYKNFRIIHENSIRVWIKNCDKIHTWYSTSITDIYFMKKNCSVLRPRQLPKSMHNKLLDSGNFTKTYEEFCYFNNNEVSEFPIDKSVILEHFYIDEKEYAYEKICDLIEELVDKDIVMNLYE